MAEASETRLIAKPRETVFAYLDQPRNHATVTPSLESAETVEQLDNGGKRARYVYGMAGITREGYLTETTHIESERMVFELSGGITGEIDISFADADGGTAVTYSADYELPGRVLAAVADPIARRFNSRQLGKTLDNLQTQLEGDTPDPAP